MDTEVRILLPSLPYNSQVTLKHAATYSLPHKHAETNVAPTKVTTKHAATLYTGVVL